MPGCYVVFHKQLGDLLLLEPTLARLRAHHEEPVEVMTRGGHAPLLSLMPGVQPAGSFPLRWHGNLYAFDPRQKTAWRTLLAPAWKRQYILPDRAEMRWYHGLLGRKPIVPGLGQSYIAEYFWKNTPVPAAEPFRAPRLEQPAEDWRPAGIGDRPFVLFNPTSGWKQKGWVASRWAQVVRRLHEETGVEIILTSTALDWQTKHCREILEKAGPGVRNLSSGTTLQEFLWLAARARLVLTVDGVASHLAQAFGAPSFTLFGPTNMANWHYETPRNRAMQAPETASGDRRLRNLEAGEVLAPLLRLWAETE